jgi:hypothetical protein
MALGKIKADAKPDPEIHTILKLVASIFKVRVCSTQQVILACLFRHMPSSARLSWRGKAASRWSRKPVHMARV